MNLNETIKKNNHLTNQNQSERKKICIEFDLVTRPIYLTFKNHKINQRFKEILWYIPIIPSKSAKSGSGSCLSLDTLESRKVGGEEFENEAETNSYKTGLGRKTKYFGEETNKHTSTVGFVLSPLPLSRGKGTQAENRSYRIPR